LIIKPRLFSKINMGRAWRIEYEGALYHLMSRVNDGQRIYLDDANRNLFLETISEMKAAKIVQIDIDQCVQAKRLHGTDKHKRDLIVYFLLNKGLMILRHHLDPPVKMQIYLMAGKPRTA